MSDSALDADLQGALRLALTPGVGRQTASQLLAHYGSATAVFAAPVAELTELVGLKKAKTLGQIPLDLANHIKTTAAWLDASPQHHLLTVGSSDYPSALRTIDDAPALLFAKGQLSLLSMPLALAIVGSRSPSPQGQRDATAFASVLAQSGLVIVSGLAGGIDTAAHEGALAVGGATIAVVGTGLDRVFPRQNTELAQRIGQSGLILSEYLLGSPPLAAHFPQRNRIISGLSLGTLVVEAALQSGSLITARMALEQGKEVFAIPGSIHSPIAKGCHQLIKQGAHLVETAQDILHELQGHWAGVVPSAQEAPTDMAHAKQTPSDADNPVLQALGYETMGLDDLQAATGWDAAQLQVELLSLELQNRVARLPGGQFQRVLS